MSEIAAIVLAAGLGTRFGAGADDSKVLAKLAGQPIVRRVVETALASRASPVIVVTGHAGARVADALAGLPIKIVHNDDYSCGMSASLKAGIAAVPEHHEGALVVLADMPLVEHQTLNALIARFDAAVETPDAVVPRFDGQRGNPVLIARGLFDDLMQLEGDQGAKAVFNQPGRLVLSEAVEDPGIHVDVDTLEMHVGLDKDT